MKFVLKDKKFENLPASLQKEIKEKLFSAEKNVATLRLLLVSCNTLIYLVFMEKQRTIEWMAYSIIAVAFIYALIISVFKPYRKFHILMSSYFTSGTDALLIALWIFSTGGLESPFYLLWYISIVAIALRYSFAVTVRVSVFYCFFYLAILYFDSSILNHPVEVLTRCSYMFLIAMGSGLLSKEAMDQIEDKITIKKSEEEIRQREELLKEAKDKLEERVIERTKELKETNQKLLRMNEDIDNFVYAASHDLKAPILNVQALFSILNEKDKSEEASIEVIEVKEKIESALERVLISINHLSNVAKAQIEVHDDIEDILFEDILQEVIVDNEETLKKCRAKVIHNFDGARQITYSRTCLKSIINNFITNAIKYKSPQREPVIEVETMETDRQVVLSVKDNGLGIDLSRNGAKLFKIFKRFHSHVEGAGIGLYMVKRMVERNNGKIEVESEVDKGTTFRVHFLLDRERLNQPLNHILKND